MITFASPPRTSAAAESIDAAAADPTDMTTRCAGCSSSTINQGGSSRHRDLCAADGAALDLVDIDQYGDPVPLGVVVPLHLRAGIEDSAPGALVAGDTGTSTDDVGRTGIRVAIEQPHRGIGADRLHDASLAVPHPDRELVGPVHLGGSAQGHVRTIVEPHVADRERFAVLEGTVDTFGDLTGERDARLRCHGHSFLGL